MRFFPLLPLLFTTRPTVNLTLCDSPSSLLQNIRYSVHPDPPNIGAPLDLAFSGDLQERVDHGTIKIKVVLNHFLTVYSSELDLCDSLKDTDLTCPLSTGHLEVQAKPDIPSLVPHGDYSVYLEIYSDKPITCMNAELTL